MNEQMQSGMEEATRLTRQGRLDEATAAIQRALGGRFAPTEQPGRSGEGPIDVTSRVVRKTQRSQKEGRHATRHRADASARGVLTPNPLNRGVDSPGVPASEKGRFIERSYTGGAGTRSYKLYVPGGYTGQ